MQILSQFFLQNVVLRAVLKGLRLSKFSQILNSPAKPDRFSNHWLSKLFALKFREQAVFKLFEITPPTGILKI